MKTQCLPFSQIPHTTRLFADYLAWSPTVQQFYSRPPQFSDWIEDETALLRYDAMRRERVSMVLGQQNRAWGASAKTMENIARLRAGASVAVTGQQVGLFGGPVFSIYKALTAVRLAETATRVGCDTVPVFWLATQDHDLAEINHTFLPGPEGVLQKLETPTKGTPDAPVGKIAFGSEIDSIAEAAATALGDSPVSAALKASYRAGETFGSAFARFFAQLFADLGVILLDPSDPELNALATPIYQSAIERAAELQEALLDRGKALDAAGYHQQVKVSPSSTLLFWVRDGARTPVHRSEGGTEFLVGDEKIGQAELLSRLADAPRDFSANALLRPVVQDFLLPTLVYTGGTAEVAYFAQAGVVHAKLLGRVTPILPRFSATIVEPRTGGLLERYGLTMTDIFQGPDVLRDKLARQALPQELQSAFDNADAGLKTSLGSIRELLGRLDKTLVDSCTTATEKMHYQLDQLRARAARAELRQTEVLGRHAQLLSNTLYPEKALQERQIGGAYFLARYGNDLLRDLHENIHLECVNHQVISI